MIAGQTSAYRNTPFLRGISYAIMIFLYNMQHIICSNDSDIQWTEMKLLNCNSSTPNSCGKCYTILNFPETSTSPFLNEDVIIFGIGIIT